MTWFSLLIVAFIAFGLRRRSPSAATYVIAACLVLIAMAAMYRTLGRLE
jgi:hypothetical protein